ncbi:MAG: DUF5684 domain-containing protein [Microbacterium sp.]|uniref:DUF5684 domain-containing protein n=1 Tax=Microbacterium sp. TaxID=51671 RepID=UPI0039E2CA60
MQLHLLAAAESGSGSLVLVLLAGLLPSLVVYVWTALALARVFAKLDVAGWKAWVPIYNAAVFLRLGDYSGWLLLLWLIPIFGPVFVYVAIVTAAHRIGQRFGYGGGMTVLAALLFPVWASVLGFGGAVPGPRRSGYAFLAAEDAESALRSISPGFGRSAAAGYDARTDLLAPSAWIPPAAHDGAAFPQRPQEYQAPSAETGAIAPEPAPAAEPAPAPVAPAPAEPEPVTSWWMPAPETPGPVVRESYVGEPDAFPEESGAVSAVYGSPIAGTPRSATSAVSAFRSGIGDADPVDDDTMIASRRRPAWLLRLPDGTAADLTADAAVLGRRPGPVHTAPGAQLIAVVEGTRTVSKTHALLRRQGDGWVISDLGSTNGVLIDGVELAPGESAEVAGEFLLGDARLRLDRREP